MLFRVAALLGRTVEELLADMSAEEFDDWCAFYQVEPWGFPAETWRMAMVCSTTANYSGRIKKATKPSDFMPRAPGKRKKVSAEELKMRLQADIEKARRDDT
jgi:hypothetical protein